MHPHVMHSQHGGESDASNASALLCGTAGDVELPGLMQLTDLSADEPEVWLFIYVLLVPTG